MATVRTGDLDTYVEQTGQGPPIVFVHAALLDHRQWAPQVDALSDAYQAVTYDVRGHGRTGGSTPEAYSFDLFAEDLHALIEELELDRPVLVGHSNGGCIAQAYAAGHPDQLSGLVLADTFAPHVFSWFERLQRSTMLKAAIPPARLIGFERVEKAMVWMHERFKGGSSGDYTTIEELRATGEPIPTSEFVKIVRTVAAFHKVEVDLAAITVPTLVLHGENAPTFFAQHAEAFVEMLPDATAEVIPGGGHASNLDNPAAFNQALRAFLERLHGTPEASAPA